MSKKWLICTFLIICSFAFGYSEQVVVSQLSIDLKNSSNYSLTGLTKNGDIVGNNSECYDSELNDTTISLSNTINFKNNIKKKFTGGNSNLTYAGATGENSIIVPVVKNTSAAEIQIGSFQLTEVIKNSDNQDVNSYIIKENYNLPIQSINLTEQAINTGNKFTYSESNNVKKAHMNAYKIQEYMIRITRQNVADSNYDVVNQLNGIQRATTTEKGHTMQNSMRFLKNDIKYMDFWVSGDEYNKEQSFETKDGVGLRFLPGNIEVYGLPTGSYRIELYSFRYSKDTQEKGSLVITKENNLNFNVINNIEQNGIDILSFSSAKFPNIEASIMTISSTASPVLVVKEIVANEMAVDNLVIEEDTTNPLTQLYKEDGNLIILDSEGKYNGKYYKKWRITYKTKYTTIDELTRIARFDDTTSNTYATADYKVHIEVQTYDEYPHQTVFGLFSDNAVLTGNYEIEDKSMNKYSWGYRGVKVANVTSTSVTINGSPAAITAIDNLCSGGETSSTILVTDTNTYNWIGGGNASNAVVINKVKSDSKGTFSGANRTLPFYTNMGITGLTYAEESVASANKTDTATFTWNSPNKSSFNTTLSEDKVIFRIVKLNTTATDATVSMPYDFLGKLNNKTEILPKCYYYTASNTNPVVDSKIGNNLDNFLTITTATNANYLEYVDFVFEAGQDEERTIGNASFSFSKDNKFIITGMPRAKYLIQEYSLQKADTLAQASKIYDYKVLTYGGYTQFEMGLPGITVGTFAESNNVFMINSINMKSSPDTNSTTGALLHKVTTLFTTKSITALNLAKGNLVPRRDEVITGGAVDILATTAAVNVTENRQESYVTPTTVGALDLKAVRNVEISSASAFEFPLDIVLCIDDSGSMGDEITAVRTSLTSFTTKLKNRGFNVNFNLITFGPLQDVNSIGSANVTDIITNNNGERDNSNYLAMFRKGGNWFETGTSTGLTKLQTALGGLNATGGYNPAQENGAWAIKKALDYLGNYGRYLDLNNEIVTHSVGVSRSGYKKSQKWVIFLTDENMNVHNQSGLFGTKIDAAFTTAFLDDISGRLGAEKDNPIITGIYNIGTSNTDEIGKTGKTPSDTGGASYNVIRDKITSSYFKRYELGTNGANIVNALGHAVNNIGLVQTWKMTYDSPFALNDGLKRQVVFSLGNFGNVDQYDPITRTVKLMPLIVKPSLKSTGTDRFYTATQQKIEAQFKNPYTSNGVNYLDKNNGTIVLNAIARSEYRGTDSKWYNFPIIKGSFIVTNTLNNAKKVYSSNEIGIEQVKINDEMIDGQKWYRNKATITSKSFTDTFGKIYNLTIDFIAETEEEAKKVSLDEIIVSELDSPKMTSFTMTNTTLATFMGGLRGTGNTELFDANAITLATSKTKTNSDGLGIADLGETVVGSVAVKGMGINAKDGDLINISFTIDDESILVQNGIQYGTVQVIYKGLPYNAHYDGAVADSNKTNWSIANLPYSNNYTGIKFNIVDNNRPTGNQSVLNKASEIVDANKYLKVFEQPVLLANTNFAPNATNTGNTNYYSSGNLSAEVKPTDVLAYLVVFDWDKTKVDEGATFTKTYSTTTDSANWVSNKNGEFSFEDGKYNYNGTVYVMNKAGAIKYITHDVSSVKIPSRGTVAEVTSVIADFSRVDNVGSSPRNDFYIDTVVPRVTELLLNKIANNDVILDGNSIAKSLLLGGISSTRPYKVRDSIAVNATISEYNYLKTTLSQVDGLDILGGTISTEPEGQLSSYSYTKSGIAIDLTPSTLASKIATTTVKVYDKAGNVASQNLSINYDDRVPNMTGPIALITGGSPFTKFTSNLDIPLENQTGVPVSVGLLNSGGINYIGNISVTGTRNLTSFANGSNFYTPISNFNNIFTLTTYSYSGVRGTPMVDNSIVLDTEINDSRTKISMDTTCLSINLTNILSTIKELVGLKSVKISTDASGTGLNTTNALGTILNTTALTSGGTLIDLSGLSSYCATPTATTYTGNIYNLTIPSGGDYKFKFIFTDRLGNIKSMEYIISMPNNLVILGKKKGSNLEIRTNVNTNNGIKVNSRKEK